MNFYYGLVDQATNAWGFVEETDPRVHQDMIFLTCDEWKQLLREQSQGRQIVQWEGEVFTAEPGRYYVDAEGWHKKTDEEFNNEKAAESRQNLINKCYEIKAAKAYGGVIINNSIYHFCSELRSAIDNWGTIRSNSVAKFLHSSRIESVSSNLVAYWTTSSVPRS